MKTHTSPWQAGRNVEALIYSALNEQRDPAEDLWGTESQTQKERQEMQLRKKTGVSERILLSHAQHQMLFSRSRFLQLRDLCLAWASRQ